MKPSWAKRVESDVFRTKFSKRAHGFLTVWPMALVIALLAGSIANAAESVGKTGVLVYKDGDRVTGQFLGKEGDILVFDSKRFGRIRVSATEAFVEMPTEAVATADTAPGPPPEPTEADKASRAVTAPQSAWYSPEALTFALRQFFGPWRGRVAFSTELRTDNADREFYRVEGRLQRKWKHDEVQLNARYDYTETTNAITTDIVKADGLVRHDFRNGLFSQYRPTLEWNRAYVRNGLSGDYVLLQQEIGAGYNLLNSDKRKLRVGISENLFNVWVLAEGSHTGQAVESIFAELELKLPWRTTLSERPVYYYSIADGTDGYENRLQLDKKLTETISIALRHETRRNNADVRAQDYDLLRVLLGFDF